MNRWMLLATTGLIASWPAYANAAEPNQTFAAATVLSPAVRLVSDSLTAAMPPDTVLGIRGPLGDIDFLTGIDDDGSPVGSGTASAMFGVRTNSGSINFAVTGCCNYFFDADHDVSGQYQVFVDVYDDPEAAPIASFNEVRTLAPNVVQEFSYFDDEWVFSTYNAYIDNTIGPEAIGDVDYFTFTGLTPGESFSAETLAPLLPTADTYLGWFDATGALVATDDDGGEELMSLISGTIPANGRLTFAVTGAGDAQFLGQHVEQYDYQLQVTTGAGLPGDFNNDQAVNGADLTVWRAGLGPGAPADADGDGDADGRDFLIWQQQLGAPPAIPAALSIASAVPEPHTTLLILLALGLFIAVRGR